MSAWGEWSSCKSEKDQSIRKRRVDKPSSNSGEPCMGSTSETRPCGGPRPQPCIFDPWQSWTTCSASCGQGRFTRLRKIRSEGHLSGQTCESSLLETHTCQMKPCISKDCLLSAWTDWSFCGAAGIQRMRHRSVLQNPEGLGRECNSSLVETTGCTSKIPHHCEVTSWSEWSSCDRTCHGGQKFRSRELLHGKSRRNFCAALKLKQAAPCQMRPCFSHSLDCEFSDWTTWGICSAKVGFGVTRRKRTILRPAGLDATGCFGDMSELASCKIAPPRPIDCIWGEWGEWSGCSCSCGGGTKRRSRAIEMSPQNGGAPCQAKDKEVIAVCNTMECDTTCEDGYWGAWMDWTQCSATCSSSYRSRRRSLEVLPNSCGSVPTGLREQFELCDDLHDCKSDKDCSLSTWGEWSECSCSCNGVRERNRHITEYARGRGRPCEDMQLKVIEQCNPLEGAQPPEACEVEQRDCSLRQWEEWSTCSATCGPGQQTRKRSIAHHSAHGGKPCEGELMHTRECNTQPCQTHNKRDCVLGAWSEWGSCSHCGGQRWRHRSIVAMPCHGGKLCQDWSMKEVSNCSSICHETRMCAWTDWSCAKCPDQCGTLTTLRSREMKLLPAHSYPNSFFFKGDKHSSCFGSQVDVAQCPTKDSCEQCSPRDCRFNAWSQWTDATCVGLCERHRVIGMMNNECGEPCQGPLLETKHCHTDCGHAVDCKLSPWTAWGHCTNLTSAAIKGQHYRHRHVVVAPEKGGLACSGDLLQTKPCEAEMPEPCLFAPWLPWTECSAVCGEGTKMRTRHLHQVAEDGGRQCHGVLQQVQACRSWHSGCEDNVRQNCRLDDWNDWSSCGIGKQRERHRGVHQEARSGGKPCSGSLFETESCREDVDCIISQWTDWDECSASCGSGHSRRQRQISKFPEYGGTLCPEDLIQIRACASPPCKSEDCEVSQWLEWSSCSASCGSGYQSRTRRVQRLRGPGGLGCFSPLAQNRLCHGRSCAADCDWGAWQQWSGCSKTCGGGLMKRSRTLRSIPTAGGDTCSQKSLSEVLPCNLGGCSVHCVDGAWDEWEEWAPCSRSCNGGETFRRRSVAVMANDCGSPPAGESRESRFCNVDIPCHGSKDCLLTPWTEWNDCSSSCDGVSMRSRKVAEFGHGDGSFCSGALKELRPCNPARETQLLDECVRGPPVDCELHPWGQWTECSATCGGGERQRSRHIAQEAYNGGFGCQEPLVEVLECARMLCHEVHDPIDCVLGEWHNWGACTSCGGERTRKRHILMFPQNGGQECPPADVVQTNACPYNQNCGTQVACTWAVWGPWGQCSMSCGVGGRKKRTRRLNKVVAPIEYGSRIPALHSGRWNMLQEYGAMHRQVQILEGRHGQEVLLSFVAGCASMLVLLGTMMRACSVHRQVASAQSRAGDDAEAPLVPGL
ncbi:thsd7aa [Symbiodinium sp. CCMP2456]|nr:thsd7aa [Symbiodinium sp. CCMP2456]